MTDFFKTTERELFSTSIPSRTISYSPVSHRQLIEEVKEQLDRKNLTITKTNYTSARDGQKMIGYMDIAADEDPDMGMRFGLRNSYDKSMSVGLVAGSQVWICSNGMLSGEIAFVRKHTGQVLSEVRNKINETINHLETIHFQHIKDKKEMEEIEMSKIDSARFMGQLFFQEDIISSRQLSAIKEDNDNPEYIEFQADNLWATYNKITSQLRGNHPDNQFQKHIDLHNYVTENYLV